MNQSDSEHRTATAFLTPNAELAAEITQALHQAGLINEEDLSLCESMLNGTAAADASSWKVLLEMPIYGANSAPPDAL